jgi:putative tricarboxylic transport membrane protein
MTRLYQIVAVIFVAFGAFVLYLSLDLSYSADYGPGPGFFSFWLGILLILLGGIDFIGTTRRPREPFPEGFIPDRPGLRRLLFISASLVAVIFLMNPLGYILTILPFSIFLLRTMGRQAWWATIIISLAGSFGTFQLFRALQVPLPVGFLGL